MLLLFPELGLHSPLRLAFNSPDFLRHSGIDSSRGISDYYHDTHRT